MDPEIEHALAWEPRDGGAPGVVDDQVRPLRLDESDDPGGRLVNGRIPRSHGKLPALVRADRPGGRHGR
jgi:hypothetical protein